jgi:hypothetical protein
MLPDPRERPLLTVEQLVAERLIPGKGRSAIYVAVMAGEIESVRIGRRLYVVTAGLWRLAGLDPPSETSEARVATRAAADTTPAVTPQQEQADATAESPHLARLPASRRPVAALLR